MSFLAPWALVWLGSIPVLVWLWRLASTKRQIQVPSLIPFEHLLRRAPKRRTRLVVTLLFWLQLAALLGLVGALARPVLFRPRANTVLAVLDTSASMGAGLRGPSAFDQAKRELLARIARKAPSDQWLIMATSPAAPLTPHPTADAAVLTRAVAALRESHLGGHLSTAAHIGRMLLATDPDGTVVVTDEARPAELPAGPLQWVTVGAPAPNVALVGLDVQGPLCSAAVASVVATVQNFSDEPAGVSVAATHRGRRLAETRAQLGPRERWSLSLTLPEGTEGWVGISLLVSPDALDVDNHAWVDIRRSAAVPIVVRSDTTAFTDTLSRWLGACEALTWTIDTPSEDPGTSGPDEVPILVMTDQEDHVSPAAVASMVFDPPTAGRPVASHWVVSSGHPIGSYLAPVGVVAASLNLTPWSGPSGVPVVAALVDGRKVPVLVANERDGRRTVAVRMDPAASPESTPVILAFLNSLRWLMGHAATEAIGEPLLVSGFQPGRVRVRRPDGSTESVETDGGRVVYEAATLAGLYQFSQGPSEFMVAVNFFNPLESNLIERASTWRVSHGLPVGPPPPSPGGHDALGARPDSRDRRDGRVAYPLSQPLMGLILVVLLIEWWRYSLKGYTRGDASIFPLASRGKNRSVPGRVAP